MGDIAANATWKSHNVRKSNILERRKPGKPQCIGGRSSMTTLAVASQNMLKHNIFRTKKPENPENADNSPDRLALYATTTGAIVRPMRCNAFAIARFLV